jgi:hypothetical protein
MPFTFSMPSISRSRPGVRVAPFRYVPGVGYQPLVSIEVVEIVIREGPEPSKAVFQYVSGDRAPDDRAPGLTPDGNLRFLFDGFAQMPEGKFDKNHSTLSFVAQGVEYRAWDEPLGYSVWRDASDPSNPTKIVWTALPVRFNPRVGPLSVANCTPEGWESDSDGGRKFSVFIDPLCRDNTIKYKGKDTKIARLWDLSSAVGYVLAEGNWDETYVKLQDVDYLNKLLMVMVPKKGSFVDPDKPDTYDLRRIIVPDTDVTGIPWPDAVWKFIEPNGYTMCFRLDADKDNNPVTYLDIYKLNDQYFSRYKDLYLQPSWDVLDPGGSNLGGAVFGHDISNIANVISVDTSPVRKELGVILAPLWKVDAANDLAASKVGKFNKKDVDFKKVSDRYRLFGADETGEGHHALKGTGPDANGRHTIEEMPWGDDVIDLENVFGVDDEGNPGWVVRRRPPYSTLWTKDIKEKYLNPQLYISLDYRGPMPAVWDGTSGTWYRVTSGYELSRDRLGIWVTQENPNAWNIGKMPKGAPASLGSGEVRTVDWLAKAGAESRFFALMLVCMIESDQHLDVVAKRRDVSPTKFNINRIVSLRDRLRPGEIHQSSYFHPDRSNPLSGPVITGSEEDDAEDYAIGKRESRQLGRWAGTATIPRLTNAYIIGDRIRSVVGRDANMQTNLDGNGREAPVYPRVVGLTWSFGGGQTTSLNLTDRRGDYGGQYG